MAHHMESSLQLFSRPTRAGHLNFEGVIETVEIIEQADIGHQFYQLPLVKMRGGLLPHLVAHMTIALGDGIGQRQGCLEVGWKLPGPFGRVFEGI